MEFLKSLCVTSLPVRLCVHSRVCGGGGVCISICMWAYQILCVCVSLTLLHRRSCIRLWSHLAAFAPHLHNSDRAKETLAAATCDPWGRRCSRLRQAGLGRYRPGSPRRVKPRARRGRSARGCKRSTMTRCRYSRLGNTRWTRRSQAPRCVHWGTRCTRWHPTCLGRYWPGRARRARPCRRDRSSPGRRRSISQPTLASRAG